MVPAIVFVVVLIIVLGAYFAFVVGPEDREQRLLRKRLKASSRKRVERLAIVKESEQISDGTIDSLLARAAVLVDPVQKLLDQAGMRMSVARFLLTCGVAAIGPAFLAFRVTGSVIAGCLVGLFTGAIPYLYVRRARTKRILKFEEQFPEGIDLITRALRAGHTFQTGLLMVADEIEAPVGTEFRLLYDRQTFGMPMSEALRSFAERVPLLDAKFFATAVLTQRDAGGNMAEVLDNLSRVIRDRFKVKRQVRVLSAHGRITGWVLAGLPPVLAIVFTIVSPKAMNTLITDPIGIKLVAVAAILQVVGTLIIRRIVDIEY